MANSTQDAIAGTTADALYQTERYGSYSYKIPVTAGTFTIELHMAEIYNSAAGARAFNVSVEGQVVLPNLDLYTQAGHDGAFNYAVEDIRVTDGTLDITLESLVDNATLAGFAVYSADGKLDTSVPEPTCSGYIGITYDDGPSGNTSAFVNALKSAGLVPVTFFVNGANIGNNSAGIRQMLEVGEVQSHGFNHNDMGSYSAAQVTDQLSRNNQAIQNAGAPKPTIFRPPYGTTNATIRSAASALGLLTVTWDVDSQDWNGASVSAIVSAAGRAQNGQVILMHENQPNSLTAIPQIAANLKSRGLCPGKINPSTGRAVAP
jgi:peptidoglycan/xylan/chitin deacetylase (PgdA/CDA1 family)